MKAPENGNCIDYRDVGIKLNELRWADFSGKHDVRGDQLAYFCLNSKNVGQEPFKTTIWCLKADFGSNVGLFWAFLSFGVILMSGRCDQTFLCDVHDASSSAGERQPGREEAEKCVFHHVWSARLSLYSLSPNLSFLPAEETLDRSRKHAEGLWGSESSTRTNCLSS